MRKVLYSLILSFVTILAYADKVVVDGIYYTLIEKGKAAEVTSNPNFYSGDIVIPETIYYEGVSYDVTTIGEVAFGGCTDLSSVSIPQSVTSIRNNAFQYCSSLAFVDIPNGVNTIGNDAFLECDGLTSLVIPNSVTSIGDWAFYSCGNLISIHISNSVTSIGQGAFQECRSLASVNIPDKLSTIENQLFYGCSSLTSVTIPNSVRSIGRYAFGGCRSLTSINIPSGVTSIGDRAFYMCNSLSNIYIPNIRSVGEYLFFECTNLASIHIPNSVSEIKEKAFYGCSNLTLVTLGKNVNKISSNAFANCSRLTDVWSYAEEVPFTAEDAFGGSFIEYVTLHVPSLSVASYKSIVPWKNFQDIVSADALVEIDDIYYRLLFQTNTAEVVGNPNKYVGDVKIPNLVVYENVSYDITTISDEAFFYCSDLLTVSIPNSVVTIGDNSFAKCRKLASIIIPHSVLSIGQSAFSGCSNLATVTIDNGVTSIGQSAFSGCSSLVSIAIPNSVTSIGDMAFEGCEALSWVSLSYGLSSISSYSFYGCSSLEEITIPPSIINIYGAAFYSSGIKTVKVLPSIPPDVENYAFENYEIINLKVPEAFWETYKSTEPWNKFGNLNVWEDAHMLRYYLDDNLYKTYALLEGDVVVPEPLAPREGYTFSGWIGLPEYMPSHDVIVSGSFLANRYKLSFILDGEAYKIYEIEYGAKLTPEPSPDKEGYSFSGWSEIPETMPAHDVIVNGYFTVNKYKLTYLLDNQVYKMLDVEYGAPISDEPDPSKEGYTFSGWSEIPKTMPAHDVIVTGSFVVNQYLLTYMVDGSVYKSLSLDYGTKITPEPAAVKEGYTFSGWSDIPEIMPAHDVVVNGTFTINKYRLIYMVNGKEYKSHDVEYNAVITQEPAPTKEGYTFSGWSGVPERMPAHDVTVAGTFAVNQYLLLYILDGKEYKTLEVDYGAMITPEPNPEQEGYSFSGWSDIPPTMPAHTVIITGTFTINSYKLTYMLNDEVYKQQTVVYGAAISPEPNIEQEGHTFSGWSEIPTTMPAHDVTITGTLTVNRYILTYILDGLEYKTFEVDYGTSIIPEPAPEKEGYTFSGWIGLPATMPARFVIVTGTFSINSYTLTYMIDDEVYKQVKYEYGAAVTPEPMPEGDYKSFEWVGVPATMPSHDVTVNAVYETGIAEILLMVEQGQARVYAPNGKLLNRPQKGLNIIVFADGKVRKVVVK